jgi:hypothetical protein
MDWSQAKRVKEDPNYSRGPNGEIALTSDSVYEQYMKSFEAERNREDTINGLQSDVSVLKSEIGDIKSLLLTLVQNQEGLNHGD